MKQIITVYCDGSETKAVVLSKEKDQVKIHKAASLTLMQKMGEKASVNKNVLADLGVDDTGGDISFENIDDAKVSSNSSDSSDWGVLSAALEGVNLNKAQFVPVVTEPVLNYHVYEGVKEEDSKKLTNLILDDIDRSKNILVSKDYMDYTELSDGSIQTAFVEGDIPCVEFVNSFANYNGKKFYKIPTIKSAELSLAYYVAKKNKFFPEDHTLIIYTGKEYSKLIFLEGQKFKHIGATVDIGTQNLHTYDVYFSKILLEMENGGIPRLDNVILCGEDNSENLLLSFYGTFPEANVTELQFEDFEKEGLHLDEGESLTNFSIPIAAGLEFFDEEEKSYKGINILPNYIRENQKMFQFGWHSYAMFPLLFAAAFLFSYNITENKTHIAELDKEITQLTDLKVKNEALLTEIADYDGKISAFGKTQTILDSASAGAEVWGKALKRVSDFIGSNRNFWVTQINADSKGDVTLKGYSLSKSIVPQFAGFNQSSILKSVLYEPLREKNAYAYILKYNTNNLEYGDEQEN